MRIEHHVPLGPYTSWKVGGTAHTVVWPDDLKHLSQWLAADQGPLLFWGLGSNVLAPDEELKTAVVMTRSFLKNIARSARHSWTVEAGVSCARLAREAASCGFKDAAFFCGIPGTIGGALRMNAGAFGGETWRHVDWVDMISSRGLCERYTPSDFRIGYRSVTLPAEGYFIRAQFSFFDHEAESQQARIADHLARRAATQPIGLPSCGSVFRNPYPQHAGALIEASGLKGRVIGDAEISKKHANFIINRGNATAGDIRALVQLIQSTVQDTHGISLIAEFIDLQNA